MPRHLVLILKSTVRTVIYALRRLDGDGRWLVGKGGDGCVPRAAAERSRGDPAWKCSLCERSYVTVLFEPRDRELVPRQMCRAAPPLAYFMRSA